MTTEATKSTNTHDAVSQQHDKTTASSDAEAISWACTPEYPRELADAERALITARRRGLRLGRAEKGRIGVALSGGGVRSATFALGIFQALARRKKPDVETSSPSSENGSTKTTATSPSLLRSVDYLSTVSGGGYFGGFFGALFARSRADCPECGWQEVERKLGTHSIETRYLRENGNYLAPTGSNDFTLGGAVLLRNWVAVTVVLLSLALVVFLVLASTSLCLEKGTLSVLGISPASSDPQWGAPALRQLLGLHIQPQALGLPIGIWFSPYVVAAMIWTLAIAVPVGWAYWLVGFNWLFGMLAPAGSHRQSRGRHWLGALWVRSRALALHALLLTVSMWLLQRGDLWAGTLTLWLTAFAFLTKYAAETCGAFFSVDTLVDEEAELRPPAQVACLLLLLFGTAIYASGVSYAFLRLDSLGLSGFEAWKNWLLEAPENHTDTFVADMSLFKLIRHAGVFAVGSLAFLLLDTVYQFALACAVPTACTWVQWDEDQKAHNENRKPRQLYRKGEEHDAWLDRDLYARHRVSWWLKWALQASALVLAAALLHSAGRTFYAHLVGNSGWLLGGIGSALMAAAATGRKLIIRRGERPDGKRPSWMAAALLYAAAGTVVLAFLLAASVAAEAFVHRLQPAVGVVPTGESKVALATLRPVESDTGGWARIALASPLEPSLDIRILHGGKAFFAFFVASLLFGLSRRFLNDSTHLALYSARLTRTFLGASNPERVPQKSGPDSPSMEATHTPDGFGASRPPAPSHVATHLIHDDDIDPAEYWRHPDAPPNESHDSTHPSQHANEKADSPQSPYDKGAPLHLINVTINETVDGRSKTQQNDRKGVGMALGPCGLSAGVRHHAIFRWEPFESSVPCGTALRDRGAPQVYPKREEHAEGPYRVFDFDRGTGGWAGLRNAILRPNGIPEEKLSIGRWLGISGAAFTTGLGWRTNLGLSLLTGLANVRLGHWWASGARSRKHPLRRTFAPFFWVQKYLLRELGARFPGTATKLWYLSDGGHFDNMGGYELIRRRVDLIILVDAEADPDYELEGLGNFVRKARLDFGAEIDFLERDTYKPGVPALEEIVQPADRRDIGTLEELRRGPWRRRVSLPPPDGAPAKLAENGYTLDKCEHTEFSQVHAAVAKITYASDGAATPRHGLLLYIKPTLTGDEPVDVLRYHTEHPAFPHEPTYDQVFDEPQWESYRRLGEHVGEQLFKSGKWPIRVPEND